MRAHALTQTQARTLTLTLTLILNLALNLSPSPNPNPNPNANPIQGGSGARPRSAPLASSRHSRRTAGRGGARPARKPFCSDGTSVPTGAHGKAHVTVTVRSWKVVAPAPGMTRTMTTCDFISLNQTAGEHTEHNHSVDCGFTCYFYM